MVWSTLQVGVADLLQYAFQGCLRGGLARHLPYGLPVLKGLEVHQPLEGEGLLGVKPVLDDLLYLVPVPGLQGGVT